jgi:dipeptide/tripeptide permease
VGRGLTRVYLANRQAVALGAVLLAAGVAVLGLALWRREADLALVGLCLGWLGAVLAHRGRRAI